MLKAFILKNTLKALFPKVRAELLHLLFLDSETSLHLRELARLSGLAVGTVQREVSNMREAELIQEKRDGNRLYFSANKQHPIFSELRSIILKTSGLSQPLSDAISTVRGVDLAFVYGSIAKGDFDAGSDIDLYIIGSVGLRKLASKLREVSESLAREINPTVTTKNGYRDRLLSGDVYLENVVNGPKLWIIGSDDELAKLEKERVVAPASD